MAQHKAIFEVIRHQEVKLAEQLILTRFDHAESLAEASHRGDAERGRTPVSARDCCT
jgi:hypothetical protein